MDSVTQELVVRNAVHLMGQNVFREEEVELTSELVCFLRDHALIAGDCALAHVCACWLVEHDESLREYTGTLRSGYWKSTTASGGTQ